MQLYASGAGNERWKTESFRKTKEQPVAAALAAGLIKGTYTGLPSFGPDHFMVVLKK